MIVLSLIVPWDGKKYIQTVVELSVTVDASQHIGWVIPVNRPLLATSRQCRYTTFSLEVDERKP